MQRKIKEKVKKEETLDRLEIRLGRVISVEDEPNALKKSYKLVVDFGKFGVKTTVARLTHHKIDDLINQIIVGVLNFDSKVVGDTVSEFLLLGSQYPKADSGEASFLTIPVASKIGGKIF